MPRLDYSGTVAAFVPEFVKPNGRTETISISSPTSFCQIYNLPEGAVTITPAESPRLRRITDNMNGKGGSSFLPVFILNTNVPARLRHLGDGVLECEVRLQTDTAAQCWWLQWQLYQQASCGNTGRQVQRKSMRVRKDSSHPTIPRVYWYL